MDARDVSFTALFVAFTAVSAQIRISFGPVPITFQVFAVVLSGLVLGARRGFMSQLVYVLSGAVGLPFFTGFTGGFAHIYGPTGGYLIAFPFAALVAGLFAERSEKPSMWFAGSLAALAVIYLLGWLWLGLYFGGNFEKAFTVGVLPFIPFDIAKVVLAVVVAKGVKRALPWL